MICFFERLFRHDGARRRAARGLVCLALVTVLSACTFSRPSEPRFQYRDELRAGDTVPVKPNENIYLFSQRHNVSMREVIALNGLKPPFDIRAGQMLVLPAGGSSFAGELKAPQAAPLEPVEQTRLDTISIAPMAPPPVETHRHEGGGVESSARAAPDPLQQGLVRSSQAQKPVLTTTGASNAPSQKDLAALAPTAAPTSPPKMKWPVKGPVLSSFGPKGAGMNNDGVNIGAPKGAPVVAAAAGTVAYAGNDMKGFGNLVLIRHRGDLITAYAHLDRVLVKKDTVVAMGDMIGTVGNTGNVSTPQLHFEIRRDGKPVDPAIFINRAS